MNILVNVYASAKCRPRFSPCLWTSAWNYRWISTKNTPNHVACSVQYLSLFLWRWTFLSLFKINIHRQNVLSLFFVSVLCVLSSLSAKRSGFCWFIVVVHSGVHILTKTPKMLGDRRWLNSLRGTIFRNQVRRSISESKIPRKYWEAFNALR